MLERLKLPATHALTIILKDHDTVKDLFDHLEKAGSAAEKEEDHRTLAHRAEDPRGDRRGRFLLNRERNG